VLDVAGHTTDQC